MYSPDALPRRRFLGLHVESTPDGSLGEAGAMHIRKVLAGGAAADAGVEAGDRLLAIDGCTVQSPLHLVDLARGGSAGSRTTFRVERGGAIFERSAMAPPSPIERLADGAVELGHVVAGHVRLRTVTSVPSARSLHPAILFLPGIRAHPCESPLDLEDPVVRLVDGWTSAGFLTQRVERSGVGDSEGPSPQETDLGVELDGYDAALDSLLARRDVDQTRVFLFGHSFGGMLAPIVAAERGLAGVVTFGSSARRWHDCFAATSRRKLQWGWPTEDQASRIAAWIELHLLVCRHGWSPARLFEKRPDLAVLRSRDCDGETLFGRHVALLQQLDGIDLQAAWAALREERCPVLSLHGGYDWVCGRDDAESIAAAAGPLGQMRELERIGHDFLAYPGQGAAFAHGKGRWEGSVLDAAVSWMTRSR
jgi:uncharacterized protein